MCRHTGGRGIRSQSPSGITRARNTEISCAKFQRHGNRKTQAPGLKRSGRVDSFFLQPEFGKTMSTPILLESNQWSETLSERDNVLVFCDRKEFPIPPEIGLPPCNPRTQVIPPFTIQCIAGKKASSAFATNSLKQRMFMTLSTLRAFEV
jgi:hypothetical protein